MAEHLRLMHFAHGHAAQGFAEGLGCGQVVQVTALGGAPGVAEGGRGEGQGKQGLADVGAEGERRGVSIQAGGVARAERPGEC